MPDSLLKDGDVESNPGPQPRNLPVCDELSSYEQLRENTIRERAEAMKAKGIFSENNMNVSILKNSRSN